VTGPADGGALGRIVVVEDDAVLLDQLKWALKGKFEVAAASDARYGRALCESDPDLYLFDLRLPPSGTVEEGLNLLRHVRGRDPDATVVVMSGEPDRAAALKAVSLGAFDFFHKQFDPGELLVVLRRALERRRLLVENRELREAAQPAAADDPIVGDSAPMRRLLGDVRRIADSEASVLLVGESGTGKELVARAVHTGSPRRGRAFVAVNAAALPESLAEAELFGHEKGAFTGAVASRPGRFELAHGGTLFLDEIGTLSPAVQSKLLRALESREVERVGGRRAIRVDFRLVSATNESLEQRVAAGTFREDLFYRINAVVVRIPPLRERPDDIPLLARHFLQRLAARHGRGPKTLSTAVLERLRAHPWHGNVRELRHAVETLVLFSDGEEIGEEDLPRALRSESLRPAGESRSPGSLSAKDFATSVADFEKRLLADAIAQAGGVKAEAARRLGLDSNQIKYLCRKYGL
jgi:two-component system, NtrC family, response regulator HydG